MTYERGRDDYQAIAAEAADPLTPPVEVSAEEYEEMLGAVPPIYVPGGFLVGEALTGHETGTVFAHYAERGGRFFARYAILGRPETYIPPRTPLIYLGGGYGWMVSETLLAQQEAAQVRS